MLKNFIKIAWRNIVKSPFYSFVNIIGLSAGIAFTILIAAYGWGELQVNRGLKNADRQYILQSKWKDPNLGYELATLGPLAKELKERYPDLVADYYRYDGITSNVSKGDKNFREGLQVCDSTMLHMYGFRLLHGNPATAFAEPFSVIISTAVANKYFGKTEVVGQTLTIENFSGSRHDFMITGVLDKFSRNSVTHLVDDYPNSIFISSGNLAFFGRNMNWNNPSIASYVELQNGVTPRDLEKPIQYLVKQNTAAQVAENLTPYLVPLNEYYLVANNSMVKKMLYALSAIALFILFMAVINFVNMSISRSATRMKEIGIRKVLGGLKKQLIMQFLAESIILVFFATLIATAIYSPARDLFIHIVGKEIPSLTQFPLYFFVFPFLLIGIVGFMAGIYPAFVLSSLKSVDSLKGKLNSVKEKVFLRKSLVAFQFGTATIVFVGAIIVTQQISLFFSKDLGYNKDFIISAQLPRNWSPEGVRRMETLRRQFVEMPQVKNVTLSYEVPDGNNSGNSLVYKAGADSTTAISTQLLFTDEYYASTYSIPMAAGIFYCQPGTLTDSFKIVINETQSKAFGWNDPKEAIGKQLKFPGSVNGFTVSGVTRDFHFGSMQKAIQPVTFLHVDLTTTFRYFSFKLKPGNIGQSITALQNKWSALMPGTPFEYHFMDDTLKKLYKTEIQLKQATYTATVLSLIIVFLGVLGLISLSVQKRTKEIGIRKVLGSSVKDIIALFIKEFLWIILIAGIIACPVAYLLMKNWLSDYVYRIDITAMPFITAIVLLGLITGILIIMQTIKTALANPVKSLRTE
ncbi:MAG: transporter permease [Chitinophagaceae bacterium]|nr:transporter permease [Chitinophagaceae bacterium]